MSERGSVTIWLLGLCVCVLFLAGLSVDLWRVMNVRRELVSLADAAAIDGATVLDEAAYRASGMVVLDPDSAARQVRHVLSRRLPPDAGADVAVEPGRVRVTLRRRVRLSLLGVLMPGETLTVTADAEVRPVRRP